MAQPSVSIIVAAADAADSLADTLDSIDAQDYPGETEVVVAAADPATAAVATGRAIVVENPSGATPTALNLAASASSGEIILRLDAHARIPRSYVTTVVRTLETTNADNVGGMQIPIGSTFIEKSIAIAMASPFGAGDATYRIGGPAGPTDTVYLGAFRRQTFEDLGGFDETYRRHQDYELNQRIRENGGTVWFEPSLRVEYRPRSSFVALAKQYFQYGRWKRVFSRAHPGSLRLRQIAPPLLVAALSMTIVGSIWVPWLLIVPATYLSGLLVVGLAYIRNAGGPALLTPIALLVMHVSWGFGFLIGHRSDS